MATLTAAELLAQRLQQAREQVHTYGESLCLPYKQWENHPNSRPQWVPVTVPSSVERTVIESKTYEEFLDALEDCRDVRTLGISKDQLQRYVHYYTGVRLLACINNPHKICSPTLKTFVTVMRDYGLKGLQTVYNFKRVDITYIFTQYVAALKDVGSNSTNLCTKEYCNKWVLIFDFGGLTRGVYANKIIQEMPKNKQRARGNRKSSSSEHQRVVHVNNRLSHVSQGTRTTRNSTGKL